MTFTHAKASIPAKIIFSKGNHRLLVAANNGRFVTVLHAAPRPYTQKDS